MTDQTHPRVADINARIAAGENLTDIDSQYLDMIGDGYSPEEADRLVPMVAIEPSLAELMTELLRLRRAAKTDPEAAKELRGLKERMRSQHHMSIAYGDMSRRPGKGILTSECRTLEMKPEWAHSTFSPAREIALMNLSAKHMEPMEPQVGSYLTPPANPLKVQNSGMSGTIDPDKLEQYMAQFDRPLGELFVSTPFGKEPGELQQMLNNGHVPSFLYSSKHYLPPVDTATPKITDEDWAAILEGEGSAEVTLGQVEDLVASGKAIISDGKLVMLTGKAEDIDFRLLRERTPHPFDDFLSCRSLSNEADCEISFQTTRMTVVTRHAKVWAKKGPRVLRSYRIPPKRYLVDMRRGKHRGHLPTNMGGTRLFAIGSTAQGILTANDAILARAREETIRALGLTAEQMNADSNGGLSITPELQAELREAFGRKPGWLRKKVAGKPDNPMSGVPVRNPLPIPMEGGFRRGEVTMFGSQHHPFTARYTGEIQMGARVRWNDPDDGLCTAEGEVIAISINNGVDTIFTVRFPTGGIVEAPASELTLLKD